MMTINPKTLTGSRLQLEVMNPSHFEALNAIAQDKTIWTYATFDTSDNYFEVWFTNAIKSFQTNESVPFIIRRLSDQKIVGSTRYYHISPEHHRLSIGYTWTIPEVWGTFVNTESKYLLLQNAFEVLAVNRVEFLIIINLHFAASAVAINLSSSASLETGSFKITGDTNSP